MRSTTSLYPFLLFIDHHLDCQVLKRESCTLIHAGDMGKMTCSENELLLRRPFSCPTGAAQRRDD